MALSTLWFNREASVPEPTCPESELTLVGSVSFVSEGSTGSENVVIKGVDRDISSRDISSLRFFERTLITSTTLIITIMTITPIAQSMRVDISVSGVVIVCVFVVMIMIAVVIVLAALVAVVVAAVAVVLFLLVVMIVMDVVVLIAVMVMVVVVVGLMTVVIGALVHIFDMVAAPFNVFDIAVPSNMWNLPALECTQADPQSVRLKDVA